MGEMFQFTHPVRGATMGGKSYKVTSVFQFTHPVRGATRLDGDVLILQPSFQFQFTHPVRGATARDHTRRRKSLVSIHAPRAGCDFA